METNKHLLRVDRKDIAYLRGTIEAYDGMAVVSTIDPQEAIIEVRVSPGCEGVFFELVNHMVTREYIKLSLPQRGSAGLTREP
jgi:hypothetical protein